MGNPWQLGPPKKLLPGMEIEQAILDDDNDDGDNVLVWRSIVGTVAIFRMSDGSFTNYLCDGFDEAYEPDIVRWRWHKHEGA